MNTVNRNHIEMLQFEQLSSDGNISHFCTTRCGYCANSPYSSFNLATHTGDSLDRVSENRQKLCQTLGIGVNRLIVPQQTHSNCVKIVDEAFLALSPSQQQQALEGVDGLITSVPNLCIAIGTADCVPILLYDPHQQVVAAIHAGWRGTVAHIVQQGIEMLKKHFGTNPQRLQTAIGAAIGVDHFMIGSEVSREFVQAGFDLSQVGYDNPQTEKHHINLSECNRLELIAAGVPPQQIEVADICTYTHRELFYSARREGIASGRMLTGILIKSNPV